MTSDRIPMSKDGYEKLKAQLDQKKNEDMPRIAEQIAQARAFGDLSENAEYDAAREAQGMLQARINDLQDKLARGMIVDRTSSFGALRETAKPRRCQPCLPMISLVSRRIPSIRPTVEIVTFDIGRAGPEWSVSTAIAWSTLSRLSSGSPIPMNTMFVIGASGSSPCALSGRMT